VTNYVVAETLSLIGVKLGPGVANEMLDRRIAGAQFAIDHAPKPDFNAAQAPFRRHGELSVIDSTISADMDREAVEYLYSFDDHFDDLDGGTRLVTAERPCN
jgi:predicted nucleic acid-binding protein